MSRNNKRLQQEFEKVCQMSVEEWKEALKNNQVLNENNGNETCSNEEIMEVDDIDEYMKSLGFSSLEEIKKQHNI